MRGEFLRRMLRVSYADRVPTMNRGPAPSSAPWMLDCSTWADSASGRSLTSDPCALQRRIGAVRQRYPDEVGATPDRAPGRSAGGRQTSRQRASRAGPSVADAGVATAASRRALTRGGRARPRKGRRFGLALLWAGRGMEKPALFSTIRSRLIAKASRFALARGGISQRGLHALGTIGVAPTQIEARGATRRSRSRRLPRRRARLPLRLFDSRSMRESLFDVPARGVRLRCGRSRSKG